MTPGEEDHQVIMGALNAGENAFSLGGVDGANFVACAVGRDVVVLTPVLERIQILLGRQSDTVSSINCCRDSGKIAACYKNIVRIFEPSLHGSSHVCQYRWTEVQTIQCPQTIDNVQWSLRGLRLLVISGEDLLLYQHKHLSTVVSDRPEPTVGQSAVKFALSDEDILWENVWSCKLSARVKYAKFSPDGTLFATCGAKDKLIKIWYQLKDSLSFTFIYLQHPAPVCGFEWRLSGRYMKYVQNALISWCEDNTSRIWKEIPSRDSAYELIIEAAELAVSGVAGAGPDSRKISNERATLHRHVHLRRAKKRLVHKLSHIMKKKKTTRTLLSFSNPVTNIGRSLTIADFSMPAANNSLVFALAGTINAENDCYLVPSMKSKTNKPFTVHWLNNKEIFFTYANEKILSDTVTIEQNASAVKPNVFATSTSTADILEPQERSTMKDHHGVAASTPALRHYEVESPSSRVSDVSTRDLLDYKLEEFLREWNKSFDILFSVHPVDGSLLTWSVEWLDDYWKQANISFSSRFPDAFPLTDASSLYPTLCVFNARESTLAQLQRRHNNNSNEKIDEPIVDGGSSPSVISMLTNHENGSLNLWHLKMDEHHHFSTILSVSHRSRMCGHRFHISTIIPHPTLPLLLTTSQFRDPNGAETFESSVSESELILWATAPVAPLCRSGGLRELSRITINSSKFFSFISWIPIIIPSFAMGAECNSPSACFVASNDNRLAIFQAIVDGRGILSRHANIQHSQSGDIQAEHRYGDLSVFQSTDENNAQKSPYAVVSTQSSSRPGCILHVGNIADSSHQSENIIFLHVFVENSTVSNRSNDEQSNENCIFLERYLVIMVQRTADEDRLRMWSVTIRTETINATEPVADSEMLLTDIEAEMQDTSAKTNIQIVRLVTETAKVYDQPLHFGDDIRIVTCAAAADHLPSASLYPSCKTPYTFVAAFSDEKARFLRCIVTPTDRGDEYSLISWKMSNQLNDSSLQIDGEIYHISSAYSGRFACVYKPADACIPEELPDTVTLGSFGGVVTAAVRDLELAVFECESSGGVEWVCEDVIPMTKIIDNMPTENDIEDNSEDFIETPLPTTNQLVRINWVSTEDGAHILTVGVGHVILFFVQTSRTVTQHNLVRLKQQKISPDRKMSTAASAAPQSNRLVRWSCIRTIRLLSADGLPPFPTAISWVRDGLLIVGMNSEMRVYNQWNIPPKSADLKRGAEPVHGRLPESHKVKDEIINISRSHSMLDQMDRKVVDRVASSRLLKQLMINAISSPYNDNRVWNDVDGEGLFEACRLSDPMLPQYHPKQLIELLNAGKTKRVKAILLHVLNTLKHRQVALPNPLSRAASLRRMHITTANAASVNVPDDSANLSSARRPFVAPLDDNASECYEIDIISPLPLYSLIAADSAPTYSSVVENEGQDGGQNYDSLFKDVESDEDLDEVLDGIRNDDGDSHHTARTRHSSGGSERIAANTTVTANFTTRHSRMLTEQLTHTHLPGLSSVDQMHLLAIADTISHFSPNVMDKLTHVNAALQPTVASTLGDSMATGYANATMGTETVDECGLRFLMAMKQHEYLILCLPPAQRKLLKARGISMAHIIWAFHSVTETELLSAIPCCQKSQEMWEELRAYGVAWWVKNTSTLRICVEKMAKCAFQQNQDPMDASLFYLALRKKNVLMHLFKTVNNSRMFDFFREDFNEDKWKRAALKNAFALMSKQRYQHAAAFFLLGGSLKDAVQTIFARLKDIQLAMIVIRLYEVDPDAQCKLLTELLCNEVLGCSEEQLRNSSKDEISSFKKSSKNPFERSMACWLVKEYAMSASTLVEEASCDHLVDETAQLSDHTFADIFNFYSYIRRHPLVLRQRLTNQGKSIMSTDKFLTFAKELEKRITPSERRLYFRTAFAHISSGCPLLTLDVLSRLPKQIEPVYEDRKAIDHPFQSQLEERSITEKAESMDWSAPVTDLNADDQLELKWSDDESNSKDEQNDNTPKLSAAEQPKLNSNNLDFGKRSSESNSSASGETSIDFIAQHLKFVAVLRIMMDELATLASGTEISGGQLRNELFSWLTNECQTLHEICDFQLTPSVVNKLDLNKFDTSDPGCTVENTSMDSSADLPLHESLYLDRMNWHQQTIQAVRRRRWLRTHQKLLRILAAYCALHSAQNYRLTSIQMELLLLLLEVQTGSIASPYFSNEPVARNQSFPLLISALNNCRMFVLSPLQFIRNQSDDILLTIAELRKPPSVENNFSNVFMIYNLCQGLSSCLYQSLTNISRNSDNHCTTTSQLTLFGESLVQSPAAKWPGVESLVALLNREKDEETPSLRLLLVEFFVAISTSLFAYALAICDARWLFRLGAHELDEFAFAAMFGGSCQRRLRSTVPTRPPPPKVDDLSGQRPTAVGDLPSDFDDDSAAIRAKLHVKVFGADVTRVLSSKALSAIGSAVAASASEQTISCWVPPKKHIVQFFAEKVNDEASGNLADLYDSEADEPGESSDDENDYDTEIDDVYGNPVARIQAYAWLILRLASVNHLSHQIRKFVTLAGFEVQEITTASTHLDNTLRTLNEWSARLELELESFDGGRPDNIIRNLYVNSTPATIQQTPLLHKYSTLLEPDNTPFQSDSRSNRCARRLWNFLIRKEHLSPFFIKHIFKPTGTEDVETGTLVGTATGESNGHSPELPLNVISEAVKIIQRENEPIMAFACNTVRLGNIVLSTGRELQEINIERILENRELLNDHGDDSSDHNLMSNRVQLDIAMQSLMKNTLRDNDDYQLITPSIDHLYIHRRYPHLHHHPHHHHSHRPLDGTSAGSDVTSTKLTPFIIDRSRVVLQKLCKRPLSGIRRLESHSTLPYYLSGSTDGSILLWEWGVDQPLFTARVAGQYAKVTKLAFAQNSNKFAAVDGDGLLCIWQSSQYCSSRRPFFSHRCHTKTVTDVKFLGQTSSLLVTAGHGIGEQNVILWDTLLPQNKAMVHSFVGHHQEGATCVAYLPNSQSILSGGRHGELCLWDLRQCQLRTSFKAFDNGAVRCMCVDTNSDIFVVGSSEGDIKIWSTDVQPQLLHTLSCEHVARSGFTLRKLGASSSIQGVQQVFVDVHQRLFSCGADSSLKLRNLPFHLSSL